MQPCFQQPYDPVNALLRCQSCLELFTDPHSLPCGHRFCHDCLDGIQCLSCSAPYYRQDVMRSTIVASALSKYRAYLDPSSQEAEESEERPAPASQPTRSSAAAVAVAGVDSEHAVLQRGQKRPCSLQRTQPPIAPEAHPPARGCALRPREAPFAQMPREAVAAVAAYEFPAESRSHRL